MIIKPKELEYHNTNQFIEDYRKILDENGIIYAHIARQIGISPQQLQNVFKKKELTVTDITRLCAAINKQVVIIINNDA